jgi:sugar diacid utilization regulator
MRRVPTIDQLLRTRTGRALTLVAGPADARDVETVAIVDAIEELETAPAGALALLSRHASSLAAGYQLDVALRVGAQRRIAALAVYGEATTSLTAIRLAGRARVALLAVDPRRDLGELAFALDHGIREDARAALDRIMEAIDAVEAAERHGTLAVIAAAGEATGATLRLAGPDAPGAARAAVVIEGRGEAEIVADRGDAATHVAVRLAAEAVSRIWASERRALRAPARERAEVLTELLLASGARRDRAAVRAEDLGLPVHGWHVVARIEPADAAAAGDGDALLDAALAAIAAGGHDWQALRAESTLMLLRSWRRAPGERGAARALAEVDDLLVEIRARRDGAPMRCGVAGPRSGAEGLRTCAGEALAALSAARSLGRVNAAVPIDAVALPRTLIDWLTSDAGRLATQRLLEPLDALGTVRAETAVRTLHVYLDEQGSLVRCAERLHLHRNAVAYRLRQIREHIGSDLDDPDQRLALQLACRARLLGSGA